MRSSYAKLLSIMLSIYFSQYGGRRTTSAG